MIRFLSTSLAARALILALLGICLRTGTASAQVPHDMAYQGHLTDSVGAPLTGPVDLQIRIFDVIASGAALYIEDHTSVAVDDSGAFNIRLGTGSTLTGTFNTALFAGVNRYLEVVVDGERLEPRLAMGSVPYAMQAESAPAAQSAADAAQATADAAQASASAAMAAASAAQSSASAAQSAISSHAAPGCTTNYAIDTGACPFPETNLTGYNELPNCTDASVQSLCEGDGECGTSNDLNNCFSGYDVYYKADL